MRVTRMNAFMAKEDTIGELRAFLGSIIPFIAGSSGCISCRLLHSQEDPKRFVVIEEWESKEAHQASAQNIPVKDVERVIGFLAAPPAGEYYSCFDSDQV